MRLYIGVTDRSWFHQLAADQPDEVNFWKPGGQAGFAVLKPGGPFLFKLHSPLNFIVGGGFFVSFSRLPVSIAWETFERKNGARSFSEFRDRIRKYRAEGRYEPDPVIGCIVLTAPFFLPRELWIPVPEDWASNIVQGKSYSTDEVTGQRLWADVQDRICASTGTNELAAANLPLVAESGARYGAEFLAHGRLGQGAFRVLVTNAYDRRCAITGEKTLPALEAAHIQPFEEEGPHRVQNGLLLRADLHKLFDCGLITVTPDRLEVEVSKRIREEWENGRDYYRFQGAKLPFAPRAAADCPASEFLRWHNENRYRG
jgi:putative restriction endonuclease